MIHLQNSLRAKTIVYYEISLCKNAFLFLNHTKIGSSPNIVSNCSYRARTIIEVIFLCCYCPRTSDRQNFNTMLPEQKIKIKYFGNLNNKKIMFCMRNPMESHLTSVLCVPLNFLFFQFFIFLLSSSLFLHFLFIL